MNVLKHFAITHKKKQQQKRTLMRHCRQTHRSQYSQ